MTPRRAEARVHREYQAGMNMGIARGLYAQPAVGGKAALDIERALWLRVHYF